MEVKRLLDNLQTEEIYGLIGNINLTTNNENYGIVNDHKPEITVKEYLKSEKSLSSLKMVLLDENIENKRISECSESEIKRINLAKVLIENKEYIVLDYFEKGLNKEEKEYFKRLFKKLANTYHKTILIFTNDITFLWEICKKIILVDEYMKINYINKEEYFNILDVIDKPDIIDIIDLIREKGLKIENYKNEADLLKAIYRLKENK